MSLKNFEKQLKYLQKNNFTILKLSELFERLNSGKPISNCVCLTFDDGYKDNVDFAYPLLKKYKIPATIFVSTDYLGQTMTNSEGIKLPIINEEDMRKLRDHGVEFLPHTHTHKDLSVCNQEEIVKELEDSAKIISQIIGRQIPLILAYPKGKHNKLVIDVLRAKDWLGAVTVCPGLVNKKTEPYLLPRNAIVSTSSFIEFKVKISKAILCYNALKRWV